jgi:hypothetical protein
MSWGEHTVSVEGWERRKGETHNGWEEEEEEEDWIKDATITSMSFDFLLRKKKLSRHKILFVKRIKRDYSRFVFKRSSHIRSYKKKIKQKREKKNDGKA